MEQSPPPPAPPKRPQITSLKVKNFRTLRDVEMNDITALTVLLGPNGSGKSTVFDVFRFLSDCMTAGLQKALDKRGGCRELFSRGSNGPIVITLGYDAYDDNGNQYSAIYEIDVGESDNGPVVQKEFLYWKSYPGGFSGTVLSFEDGTGFAAGPQSPGGAEKKEEYDLASEDTFALDTVGKLKGYPHIRALRDFILDWRQFDFSARDMRGFPDSGAQKQLSESGENLANVIQHLQEKHPEILDDVTARLCRMVPAFERVDAKASNTGRLSLELKDAPFDKPVLAKYASDGTLKLLACLVLLENPARPPLICLDEPENFVYPQLLYELAEQCAIASPGSQIMAATHSPSFLAPVPAKQVRVLDRGADGFTVIRRASDIKWIDELIKSGSGIGNLWLEGYFNEPQKARM